ncbi:hypothetical protein DFP73DRAFT_488288 [Morchella snyderi]|nr:hypothetical protein DFP73DRAFT_488288 [Morchella snyderi]
MTLAVWTLLTFTPLALIALISLPTSSSSPLPDNSDGYEPAFTHVPKGRGTLDLIINCSITLTLAVWTVLHPNIIENPTFFRSLNTYYFENSVLVALVAPEFILGESYHKYREARRLVCEIRRLTAKEHLQLSDAFFTLMGGYISALTSDSVNASSVKITSEGLLQLFSTGVLSASELVKIKPDVADRSKTDALAKLLVCIQAGRMVMNCTLRIIVGLPVTLLELNVLTRVVFAVMMYAFWWRKPHNVRQPISLSPRLLDDDACLYLHYLANIEPTFVFRGRPSPPTRVKTLSIAPNIDPKPKQN